MTRSVKLSGVVCLERNASRSDGEDAAIVGIAVIATGVTVAAGCQNGCSGGGGYNSAYYGGSDVDCAGGGGDGPRFVRGPFRLNGPDVYGLDADHDGIACEPYGDYGS